MSTSPRPEIVSLLQRVVDVLEPLNCEYAFIGAIARNAWGRPRTTTDLDLEVALDQPTLAELEVVLDDIGVFRESAVGPAEVGDDLPDHLVFRSRDGIRIDVMVTKIEFQRQALKRRVRVPVLGREIWVVTSEDLVIYKLIAGRLRDLDDIEDVLEARTAAGIDVDWDHIIDWADAWEVSDRLAPFLSRFR